MSYNNAMIDNKKPFSTVVITCLLHHNHLGLFYCLNYIKWGIILQTEAYDDPVYKCAEKESSKLFCCCYESGILWQGYIYNLVAKTFTISWLKGGIGFYFTHLSSPFSRLLLITRFSFFLIDHTMKVSLYFSALLFSTESIRCPVHLHCSCWSQPQDLCLRLPSLLSLSNFPLLEQPLSPLSSSF